MKVPTSKLKEDLKSLKMHCRNKDKELQKNDQEIHRLLEDREILREAALKFEAEKSAQQITIVECTQAIKQGQKQVQKLSKQVQAAELEATRAAEQRQELLNKQKAAQQGVSREKDLVDECSRLTKLLESVENKRLQQASEHQAEQDRVKDQKAAAHDPSELQKVRDNAAAREAEMQEQMSIQMQAQMDAAARELQATKNDFRQRWDQALALLKPRRCKSRLNTNRRSRSCSWQLPATKPTSRRLLPCWFL